MFIISNLFFPIFLASGFYCIGFFFIKNFNLIKIVKKISNPIYQYSSFGIVLFLFFFYPIFFLGIIKNYLYKYIFLFIVLLGLFNFFYFSELIINFFKNKNFKNFLFNKNYIYLYFFLLYFFISLAPVTSGDSVAYHGFVSKYVVQNGIFPSENFDLALALAGVGEFLNAFAFSINANQFTTFLHFLGLLSMFGIFEKVIDINLIDLKNKQFLLLLFLSCPVLIFLISSSKPHFFYISLILFCYSSLIHINQFKKKNEISIIFIICIIFCSIAFDAKLTFAISFFLIVLNYFLIATRILRYYKIIFISICATIFLILPHLIWKQKVYNYSFYFFLFNPLPMNIPGYSSLLNLINHYESERFPLSLFIPFSLGNLTTILGIGFFSVYYLFREKFVNNKIFIFNILFFILFISFFGQKSSRFYLEIYLFIILLFILIFNRIKNHFFIRFFRVLIYIQSFFVFFLLLFGTLFLFPGSLTNNLNKKVLSNFASGYNLYNWVNKTLPAESKLITLHRSTYFSSNQVFYLDFVNYVDFNNIDQRNYWLLKLKKQNPKFILFHGIDNTFNYASYNFKDCLGGLFASQKNVGFEEARNPFNQRRVHYDGQLYTFYADRLPQCVKKNN